MSLGLVLYLIICVLLIITSVLQQGQSGGLGILGGSGSTLLGPTQGSFLSRVTTFLAVMFFIGAIFFSVISSGDNSSLDIPIDTTSPQEIPDVDEELTPLLEEDTLSPAEDTLSPAEDALNNNDSLPLLEEEILIEPDTLQPATAPSETE